MGKAVCNAVHEALSRTSIAPADQVGNDQLGIGFNRSPCPSIANLLITPACNAATLTAELSVYDRAYLSGLYKSQIEGAGHVQKAQISYEMRQAQQAE